MDEGRADDRAAPGGAPEPTRFPLLAALRRGSRGPLAAALDGPLAAALDGPLAAALDDPTDEKREAELEATLAALVERGRAGWPQLTVAPDDLLLHLGEVLSLAEGDAAVREVAALPGVLEALFAEDFHLAVACLLRVRGAAQAFDDWFAARLPAWLARLRLDAAQLDDLRQGLAERLLVAPPGQRPRIAGFTGRSPLASWVRVVVTRLAVDASRRRAELPLDRAEPVAGTGASPGDARQAAPTAHEPPELALLRRRHAADFGACLRAAVATLPIEQRELLRLSFLDRQGIDAIAARLGVHRATAARRIVAAREAVHDETRRLLSLRLGLGADEFESLAVALRSHVELSLSEVLGPPRT